MRRDAQPSSAAEQTLLGQQLSPVSHQSMLLHVQVRSQPVCSITQSMVAANVLQYKLVQQPPPE